MAQRGQQSRAHEYDARDACVHCGMYKVNVERMAHVCKPWRELEVDKAEADKYGMDVDAYRMADSLPKVKGKK